MPADWCESLGGVVGSYCGGDGYWGLTIVNIESFHWKCVFIRLKKLMIWFSGQKVQNIMRKVCRDLQRGITQF